MVKEPSLKPGLADIVERKRKDLERQKAAVPLALLEKKLATAFPIRNFIGALKRPAEVSLIAELKKASPSAGLIREYYHVPTGAAAYEKAGARALSILTETNYFLGDLGHMIEAKNATSLPVLRKDFIFDPYQAYEARAHGADAVLLIVALLEKPLLKDLLSLIRRLGMTSLVEAHEPVEVETALSMDAPVIGINSRNLKDLSMNPDAFEKMLPMIPKDKLIVAESGIKTGEDVRRLKGLGAHAMLVGESLLKQPDLEQAAKTLLEAGR
jgi:indole-3-glycerol phosphate synthase